MKAILFKEFGPSSVLNQGEIAKPSVGPTEVLIKIAFTSVNPVDWKIRLGYLNDMLPHKFPIIPGWDAAGTIAEVGTQVRGFKKGDRVYSYARRPEVKFGTYAEFVTVDESALAFAPKSVDLDAAAAVPLVALTAWQAVYDFAELKAKETVLVIAAAGGVGGFALQLAKLKGAQVVALARPNNHQYVKDLGADHVLDYTQPDIISELRALAPGGFDVIFDGAGGSSQELSWSVARKGARLVSIVDTPSPEKAKALEMKSGFIFVAPSGDQLRQIAALIDDGKLKLPEIRVRSVKEAAAAMDANMSRQERGKTVLKIDL